MATETTTKKTRTPKVHAAGSELKTLISARFQTRIKELLDSRGLSQADFAQAIGYNALSVGTIVRDGYIPSVDILCNIASEYDIPISDLLSTEKTETETLRETTIASLSPDVIKALGLDRAPVVRAKRTRTVKPKVEGVSTNGTSGKTKKNVNADIPNEILEAVNA